MGYERWLPIAPKVKKPRATYNAASLAYMGDCIYEVKPSEFLFILNRSCLALDLHEMLINVH